MAARLGARGPKKWQDSAGLILVSGSFRYARPPTRVSGLASGGNFPLIVPLDEPRECPWKLVLVKRNSKTGFYGIS